MLKGNFVCVEKKILASSDGSVLAIKYLGFYSNVGVFNGFYGLNGGKGRINFVLVILDSKEPKDPLVLIRDISFY